MMQLKPGFIRHPWSTERGDSMRADAVIQALSRTAHRGCGLHYEIYEYRLISELCALLDRLDSTDRKILADEAARQGFRLDDASVQESGLAYHHTLQEIQENSL